MSPFPAPLPSPHTGRGQSYGKKAAPESQTPTGLLSGAAFCRLSVFGGDFRLLRLGLLRPGPVLPGVGQLAAVGGVEHVVEALGPAAPEALSRGIAALQAKF